MAQKKALNTPPLSTTLVEPDNPKAVALELDELWSFVRSRLLAEGVSINVIQQCSVTSRLLQHNFERLARFRSKR